MPSFAPGQLLIDGFTSSEQDSALPGGNTSGSDGRHRKTAPGRMCSSGSARLGSVVDSSALLPGPSQCDKTQELLELQPLLEQIETSLHRFHPRSFDSLAAARNLIIDHLWLTPAESDKVVAEKLEACSTEHNVYRADGKLRVYPVLCRQRVCPICGFYRAMKLRRRFSDTIKRMSRPKFMTFTLKRSLDPIDVQARRLTSAFAKLRRRSFFKDACRQGFWVLEYTYDSTFHTWHVHLHCVVDAFFILQTSLSKHWLDITGDSFIVDIRQCSPSRASYLAKYVAKNGAIMPAPDKMASYLNTIKSIRTYGSFGKLKIREDDLLEFDDFEYIGTLRGILFGARNLDPESVVILRELHQTYFSDPKSNSPPG